MQYLCIIIHKEIDMLEEGYWIFVLGYDLLCEYLTEKGLPCDEAYDECVNAYDEFKCSEYDNLNISEYDALEKFIKEVWNPKEVD